jgi:hypothetical protein
MLISSVTGLFLFSRKFSWFAEIFLREIATFCLLARKLLIPGLSILQIASFSQKMLITATTVVTLPVFAVLVAISSAFMLSLGAIAATLIGWGSVDK